MHRNLDLVVQTVGVLVVAICLRHGFEHLHLGTAHFVFVLVEVELQLVFGLDLACLKLLLMFMVVNGLPHYFLNLIQILEAAAFGRGLVVVLRRIVEGERP